MHATKNADLEKHRTNQKSTRSSTSSHCVSKKASQNIRRTSNCQKNEKGRVRERRRAGNIYSIYFRKRRRSEIFQTPSCGAKIATGDNRFQNGLPSYRHAVCLSSFSSSSPHPPTLPPTRRRFPSLSYSYLYFRFIILWVSLLYISAPLFIVFLTQRIDTRISATRSPSIPLHGLLTSTRSDSSRLSRHNSSPLYKRSELCV
jgi:hypothetical protein